MTWGQLTSQWWSWVNGNLDFSQQRPNWTPQDPTGPLHVPRAGRRRSLEKGRAYIYSTGIIVSSFSNYSHVDLNYTALYQLHTISFFMVYFIVMFQNDMVYSIVISK